MKCLFSHPELVRALLALVPGCPAASASGFERLNCNFVSSAARQRTADMVWRIFCGDELFYLLIEFQSTVDRQMLQRVQVYAGLLSQDLHARHKSQELFTTLCVVVYSGCRKWRRARPSQASWLKPLEEEQVFFLVDEGRAGASVIGDVIRLVRAESLGAVMAAQEAIIAWPRASEDLQRDVNRVAEDRLQFFETGEEQIMKVQQKGKRAPRELSAEDEEALWKYYNNIINSALRDSECIRFLAARAEAKREGASEGRQEALRDVLGRACEAQAAASDVATKIANAGLPELENWVQRVMAGEPIGAVLGERGP
ncbi:Rpn family recombination-promoting nuclease/putative transposase [Massilia sp. SR12]